MRHRRCPGGWSYDRLGPPGLSVDGADPALAAAGVATGTSSAPSAESAAGGV